jgi:hypothetical protein
MVGCRRIRLSNRKGFEAFKAEFSDHRGFLANDKSTANVSSRVFFLFQMLEVLLETRSHHFSGVIILLSPILALIHGTFSQICLGAVGQDF